MVRKLCLWCCLCLGVMPVAKSELWELKPSLSLTADYSDNRFLSVDQVQNMAYQTMGLGVQAQRTSGNDALTISPDVRFSRYPVRSEYDNDVYSTALEYKRINRRFQWGVHSSLTRDTTLATAFEESGLINRNIDRDLWRIGPSFEWDVTPRLQLTLDMDRASLNNAETTGTGLVDYRSDTLQAAANYNVTARDQFQLSMAVTDLDVEERGYNSRDYSLNLGYISRLTPLWRSVITLGGHQTETDVSRFGFTVSDTRNNWLASLSLTRQMQAGQASISMSRSVETSPYGVLMQKDQVNASLTRSLTTRIGWHVAMRVFRTESLADISADSRDFSRIDTGVSWRYTPQISISAGYSHLYQKLHDSPDGADANLISVSLRYSGDLRPK